MGKMRILMGRAYKLRDISDGLILLFISYGL